MAALPKCVPLIFQIISIFSSCASVVLGQGDTLPCVQKLLPCQPYLKNAAPPPSCCVPLNQLVADDKSCLCTVITNPAILQSLNITKADAVSLAENCGADADLSVCSKIVPSPPATPVTPIPPSANSSTGNNTNPKSAGNIVGFHHPRAVGFFLIIFMNLFGL